MWPNAKTDRAADGPVRRRVRSHALDKKKVPASFGGRVLAAAKGRIVLNQWGEVQDTKEGERWETIEPIEQGSVGVLPCTSNCVAIQGVAAVKQRRGADICFNWTAQSSPAH